MADKTPTKKTLARQTKRRVELTETQTEALLLRLRSFVNRNLARVLEDLRLDKVSAKEALKAMSDLEDVLKEAGLENELFRIKGLFDDEWEKVKEEFTETTGKKALLGAFTRKNLDALADDRLTFAAKTIETYVNDVRSVVLDTVVAGKQVKPTDILETAEGKTFANLKTEINTTLMAYQRIVHQEKADKAGITKFLYIGPDDEVTRPFCQERVGGIFTQEEIDSWDNGQGLPANIYLGGYNCRHQLRPVSDELAQELEGETDGTV
jgi:hypothetical protein